MKSEHRRPLGSKAICIVKRAAFCTVLCAVLCAALTLTSCDLDINVHLSDPPADKATLLLTVAVCEPPLPASVESDRFYAHDASGNLYRVLWQDTRELREGSQVSVDFDAVTQLNYADGYPNGWTPRYEVRAKSVKLNLPFALPDFEEKELQSFGWDAYRHIYDENTTYNAVKKYVRNLEKEGFTVYRNDGGDADIYLGDAYLLYRDNVTILIEKSDYVCSLRYHISNPPLGNDYTPNNFSSPSSDEILSMLGYEKAIYAFEVTPRELHNATGARLYEVVTQEPAGWLSYSSMQALCTNLVLVGENGFLPLHCSVPEALHIRDTDGDGTAEICYISGGYTSGVWSEIINVLEIRDGIPTAKATDMISMRGDFTFVDGADGQLLLRETTRLPHDDEEASTDYEFGVEDGHIYVIVNGEKQFLGAHYPQS